jgi:hypothetical protein
MKKRTRFIIRQGKEFGYRPPVDKKIKPEQELEIKIVITDGNKKAKAKINVKDYKTALGLHGVSLADEMIDILLKEIDKSVTTNN